MFSYLKNYKLNKFLSQSWITSEPQQRISTYYLQMGYLKLFDISTGGGQQNFIKLINNLYTQKNQKIRLKILLLIHFLLNKKQEYSQVFLDNYKNQFGGNVQKYSNKQSSYIHPRESNTKSMVGKSNIYSSRSTIVNFQTCSSIPSISNIQNIQSLSSIKSYEEDYSDLNNYIYLHIIIPYHTYLIKLASSQHRYRFCIQNFKKQTSIYNANECWKYLNILKSVSIMKIPITNIGRYYKPQLKCMIDFIEMISFDLILYKTELQKQIIQGFQSYWKLNKNQIQSLLLQTEELLKQNQNLFELFKNRYYQTQPIHKIQPRWFEMEIGGMETIEKYYYETYVTMPYGISFDIDKDVHSTPKGNKTDRSVATTSNSIKYE